MKKFISASRAIRTHVLAIGAVFLAQYVPGRTSEVVITLVAAIVGLPVADFASAVKLAPEIEAVAAKVAPAEVADVEKLVASARADVTG